MVTLDRAAVSRRRNPPPREPAWTVDEACAWFAEGGIPIEADRLRLIIRGLRWKPAGETPSTERGGRGKPMYPVADLMRLHAAIAPWIAAQGPLAGYDPDPGNPSTDT